MNQRVNAQQQEEKNDSVNIYEEIEDFLDRNEFTRALHRLIFIPVDSTQISQTNVNRPTRRNYRIYEGKTIRKIIIHTLDPFGYSVDDTLRQPGNFAARAGNYIHIKSRTVTIRNLLLIKENQAFDAYLVNESERLIRSRRYVTEVDFEVRQVENTTDSVDIYIRELDKWSIVPGGSMSASRIALSLTDINFLGLGHDFHNALKWNHTTGRYASMTRYIIPNIKNTFVNSTVQYGSDEYGNFLKSFSVDRPFFSAFARWAGGVNVSQNIQTDSLWPVTNYMKYKFNSLDVWGGHAIRIFRGNTEYRRTTHIITSARFYKLTYLKKPSAVIDTLNYYSDENLYMGMVGLSSRQYVRDRYIFRFGIVEDVPVGQVISLTGGYQQRSDNNRYYLAAHYSRGNYHSWGYLSSYAEYGTFFDSSDANQGILNAGVNYYTNLLEIGKWKIRQFVKPQVTIGFDRAGYDSLTLNRENGLVGFYSPVLSGTSRLLLTSQTQVYAPWDVFGFHFGPYFTLTFGMLGNEKEGFSNSRVYSKFGLGVLIKNDNLVMKSFQVSIAFYPSIPGVGNNLLRFNTFGTTDFGHRNYEIGKPDIITFR